MKKLLSILLISVFCFGVLAGCQTQPQLQTENQETAEAGANVIYPLPETLDVNALDNCTVAVSLEKGDAYVNDTGKMVMDLTVYSYDVYDMVDIASLKENDVIVRRNEEVKITQIERMNSGLVRINGGEENGGFDLGTSESTVYYEIGMDDAKAYYALGEVTLPVSTEFAYFDASNPEGNVKRYYPGDFLIETAGVEYDFGPNNTSIVIADGLIVEMNRVYIP